MSRQICFIVFLLLHLIFQKSDTVFVSLFLMVKSKNIFKLDPKINKQIMHLHINIIMKIYSRNNN